MKIYVINLPESVKRRQSIEQNLQQLGLEYELVPAVHGKRLTPEEQALVKTEDSVILELAAGKKVKLMDKLYPGEIGCALSHLKVYQKIIDSGDECACILEDDCNLSPYFIEAINNLDKITTPWDIVNFTVHTGIKTWRWAHKYHFGSDPESFKKQYYQRVGLFHPVLDAVFNARRFLGATACYVITAGACKHLVEIGYPVRMSADMLTGYFAYNHLRLFKVFPAVNYYVNYCSGDSDIREISAVSEHKIVRM